MTLSTSSWLDWPKRNFANGGGQRLSTPARQASLAAEEQSLASFASTPRTATLAVLCILLAPSIFAAATYQQTYSFQWMRYFSFPVLIAEIGVVGLAITAGAKPLETFRSLPRVTRIASLIFIFSITFSTLLAPAVPIIAFGHLLITLLHGLLALCLFDALRGRWRGMDGIFLYAVGGSVALFTVTVYGLLYSSRDIADFNWVNVGTGISNVRHFGYFAVVGAGIGAGLTAAAKTLRGLTIAWVILLLSAGLIFWSGTRSGIIALVICSTMVLALAGRKYALRNVGLFASALVVSAGASLMWVPPHEAWGISTVVEKTVERSSTVKQFTSNRPILWAEAWSGIQERPLLGTGEGQIRFLSSVYPNRFNHPHNTVLQSLYQWGVIGSLAVLMLHLRAVLAIPASFRKRRTTALSTLAGIVGIGVVAMVDGPLFYVTPTLLWVIMLVILTSAGANSNGASRLRA